jgi:hypothetical protein
MRPTKSPKKGAGLEIPAVEVKDDPKHPRFTGAGVSLMFIALGVSIGWSTADNAALKVLVDSYFNFVRNNCKEWREKDANIVKKGNKGNPQICQCFTDLGVQPHQPWHLNICVPENHPGLVGSTIPTGSLFAQGYNQPPMPPLEQYDWRAEKNRVIGRGLQPVYDKTTDFVDNASAHHKEHMEQRSTCRANASSSASSTMENGALGYGETANISKYAKVVKSANATIHLTAEEMRHIDVGCGHHCNVPLMALFEFGCAVSDGIEFDPIRAYSAHSMLVWFINKLRNHALPALQKLADIVEKRVHIYLADLDLCTPAFWNAYTHVYAYDFVFHTDLMTKLVKKVHNSTSIVFVTTFTSTSALTNSSSYMFYSSLTNPRPIYEWTDYKRKASYGWEKLVDGRVYKWAPSHPDHDDSKGNTVSHRVQTSLENPKDVAYVKQLTEEGILEDPVRQDGIMLIPWPVKVAITDDNGSHKTPKLLLYLGNLSRYSNTFPAEGAQHLNEDAAESGGDRSHASTPQHSTPQPLSPTGDNDEKARPIIDY